MQDMISRSSLDCIVLSFLGSVSVHGAPAPPEILKVLNYASFPEKELGKNAGDLMGVR